MKQPTEEQQRKLLTVVALLPVLADYLEDLKLMHEVKRDANKLIETIRRNDARILNGAESEVFTQQVDIQRAFVQWNKENFV